VNFFGVALTALSASALIMGAGTQARPYGGISGLAASADSATTAGISPAGIARFDGPAYKVELVLVQIESEC
jgi:hypothetical protein